MSERYNDLNDCESCGVWVRPSHEARVSHDEHHDRIDRLEVTVRALTIEVPLEQKAEPDPECPFPMGAKVREKGNPFNRGPFVVDGWYREPYFESSGREWRVSCGGMQFDPEVLELVSEPDPVCAVCGDPVDQYAAATGNVLQHTYYLNGTHDHDATLTPPEPPVGSGWFADKWEGVCWQHTSSPLNAWTAYKDGGWIWARWPDLQPGRPAVPGGER